MHHITLTTDFGTQDYYVAQLKGCLLNRVPSLQFADVTHHLESYDIVKASFMLGNVWEEFPEGTIHLVAVNNYYTEEPRYIVLKNKGHWFIAPDNGLFSLLKGNFMNVPAYELVCDATQLLHRVYADVVEKICEGKPLEELGKPAKDLQQRIALQPVISNGQIRGTIIHIDRYDNAVVNIDRMTFERVAKNRKFGVFFRRHDPINELSTRYSDVPIGEPLCRFNGAGFLEIALNMGNAASLFGLEQDDMVQIDFYD